MSASAVFFVVFLVLLIAACIGFIVLQVKLSKMDSKWPGLVLPAITLLLSIAAAMNVFAGSAYTGNNLWNIILVASVAFLSENVSTVVLAGIYLYQRDKIKRRAELAHMSVQDL
ncbi:hypothetical protein BLI708_10605 [Bifidobacterium imperatoris]|uniref:Uncharacterized protein n=1 Tax=Bifidobacterium imperatoris TaxID=2020965 RepID=A0A2N5IVA4_9BIFI|nr:hypothetical protein [Bifidobacterium imperatoris]PLS25891.1 hypothetical protein Tam1G_0042 [Bifidobacterium imperatoris]QSY57636.1 hypothetical protein BLI708_10605 [Bifidobacterium imperatoris]